MKRIVVLLTLTFLLSGATTIKASTTATTVDDPSAVLLAPGVVPGFGNVNSNGTTTSTVLEMTFAGLVALAVIVY